RAGAVPGPRVSHRRAQGRRVAVRQRETRLHRGAKALRRRRGRREDHARAEGGRPPPLGEMLELRAETDIAAPVDRVWQILMDFDSFPRWNPFIRSVRGRPEVGCRLEVEIGASGSRGMRFHPTVTSVVPKREFRWM